MFLTQNCWNCHQNTRLVAPEFRCEQCGAVNTPDLGKVEEETALDLSELNLSVELPKTGLNTPKLVQEEPPLIVVTAKEENQTPLLSNDLQRTSIKHLIKLEKPKKVAPVAEIIPPKIENTPPPIIPRLEIEDTISISPQTETTSLLDAPNLSPVEEVIPPISKLEGFSLEEVKSIVIKDVEPLTQIEELNLDTSSLNLETPAIKKVENKVQEKQGKEPIAWLILHTENKERVYYDLFVGDNVFGRADARNPVDIELTGDNYVSRAHAYIRIQLEPTGMYSYVLKDDGTKRNPVSPSLNGTFVNANPKRLPSNVAYPLQEGDTIQIGVTKLVFKTKEISLNLHHAVKEVLDSEYIRTVEVGKN